MGTLDASHGQRATEHELWAVFPPVVSSVQATERSTAATDPATATGPAPIVVVNVRSFPRAWPCFVSSTDIFVGIKMMSGPYLIMLRGFVMGDRVESLAAEGGVEILAGAVFEEMDSFGIGRCFVCLHVFLFHRD